MRVDQTIIYHDKFLTCMPSNPEIGAEGASIHCLSISTKDSRWKCQTETTESMGFLRGFFFLRPESNNDETALAFVNIISEVNAIKIEKL